MSLKDLLQQDLTQAMKDKDELKVSTLRMLKAAVLKFEVSGIRKLADDTEITIIIGKEIKSRKDSIEQFKAGNRPEMAEKEEKEMNILLNYLPAQMGEAEITEIVKQIISETNAKGVSDKGKVMGAIMPKVKGKADGNLVNGVVMKLLEELESK